MADGTPRIVVFVHGWSVRSTATYGGFPDRLESEAAKDGSLAVDVRNIWLSKYISFRDEVCLEDLARAFEAAIARELASEIAAGKRFACITHSTGGPVIRDWYSRYYAAHDRACPMSHLIMLAPANFGSALAQLGKSRLSRIKGWFEGVEPGTGVLDWLELGSPESWDLNRTWIESSQRSGGPVRPFFFVLTGQSIDRSIYDHLNSYTGEAGSDGVVRVASANLNATLIRLVQEAPAAAGPNDQETAVDLQFSTPIVAPKTAMLVVAGRSHSGAAMGILNSVQNDGRRHPTVDAVLECLKVENDSDYLACRERFDEATAEVQKAERIERPRRFLLPGSYIVNDRYCMVIFRLRDDTERVIEDFDLVLTAGKDNPDRLPQGFFGDRQRNSRDKGTLTYFLNYDLMAGSEALRAGPQNREIVRKETVGADRLGILISARPDEGFVHYVMARLRSTVKTLERVLKPNQTTLVDIKLRRIVHRGVYELTKDRSAVDFKDQPPGDPIPPSTN